MAKGTREFKVDCKASKCDRHMHMGWDVSTGPDNKDLLVVSREYGNKLPI